MNSTFYEFIKTGLLKNKLGQRQKFVKILYLCHNNVSNFGIAAKPGVHDTHRFLVS